MNQTVKSIHSLLIRDLDRLSAEINAFENDETLWVLSGQINNTAGNLCLHLCGNIQHFFGAVIGNTGYVRKREEEFNSRNVPRATLLEQIEDSKSAVDIALDSFDVDLLSDQYPIVVFDKPMSYISFMIHLSGHLNYHLGQINYCRRLLEK